MKSKWFGKFKCNGLNGYCYEMGYGVEQDYEKALECMKKHWFRRIKRNGLDW